MKKESETKEKELKSSNKVKVIRSVVMCIGIAALLAGVTYAWFFNRMDMATLMGIQPPSDIKILGPNGSDLQLDMSYGEKDRDPDTKKITIKRVFCVESAGDFNLEIVHTTNLKGLNFVLYPARTNTETPSTDFDTQVVENGSIYWYNSQSPYGGSYINVSESAENDYKYANDTKHTDNYGEYKNVQTHVEPIYWLVANRNSDNNADNNTNAIRLKYDEKNTVQITDPNDGTEKTYYRTYFVCEISWTETMKETDIFYILAQNAQ